MSSLSEKVKGGLSIAAMVVFFLLMTGVIVWAASEERHCNNGQITKSIFYMSTGKTLIPVTTYKDNQGECKL